MSTEDSLGDRMKDYEGVPRTRLTRRVPVIMRLDGKAFHTFTRGMERPYYRPFHEAMWAAAKHLCANIQGAQVAYVQSDEITILLTDYAGLRTEAWFDYQVQKMCSVAAAMCSVAFNVHWGAFLGPSMPTPMATFDCRVANYPKEEVVNNFIWRQQDATRNAIQMAGQAHFSHKELHGVNCDQIQEKLFTERDINFNDYPVPQKRGVCIVKETYEPAAGFAGTKFLVNGKAVGTVRSFTRTRWVVDENIPIFTMDRGYIEKYVNPEAECSDTSSSATPTPNPTT